MGNVQLFLLLFSCSFFFSARGESALLEALRDCKKTAVPATEENIEQCLLKKLPTLHENFAVGDREVNLPPLEPVLMQDLNFTETSPNLELKCGFTNISVKGFTDYAFRKVKPDYKNKNVSLELYYENLLLTGRYNMEGKISFLPINGNGSFWLNFDDMIFTLTLELYIKDNRLQAKIPYIYFITEKPLKMRFNNIFKGDPVLAETINVFINDNSEDIIAEVKPQMLEHLHDEFYTIFNDAFNVIQLQDVPGAELLL